MCFATLVFFFLQMVVVVVVVRWQESVQRGYLKKKCIKEKHARVEKGWMEKQFSGCLSFFFSYVHTIKSIVRRKLLNEAKRMLTMQNF